MEKLACLKITDNLSPKDASEALALAHASGCDKVIILNEDRADFTKAKYKEKLLSVFRGAFRHKTKVYLSDDNFPFSGTGFGQLSSVRDMWQRVLLKINKEQLAEDEVILAQKGDECIVARYCQDDLFYPYGHFPDLTNPLAANMIIDFVYAPALREYAKFVAFELSGFACIKPMWEAADDGVPYSSEALKIFKDSYKREADLFALMDNGDEYEKYALCVRLAMEQNYLLPLKAYCKNKGVDFIVCGGDKSASADFCKKEGILYLTDTISDRGGYLMSPKCGEEVVQAIMSGMGSVLKIERTMPKLMDLIRFLEAHNNLPVVSVEDFDGNVGEGVIITNMSPKTLSVCFLTEGDYCVADFEKDEHYDFEKDKAYTFYPYSFLCIKRKPEGMFTDYLPVRVGGVLCTWRQEETPIEFETVENVCHFYLPDTVLFGRCIEFVGDAESLYVQLGSMEHTFVTKPYVLPLFDFLRYAGGCVQSFGGKIEKIVIK